MEKETNKKSLKFFGGSVNKNGKQYRVIFSSLNKKNVLEHFYISNNVFRNFFCETGNSEEVELLEKNKEGVFIKLNFDYKDDFKEYKIGEEKENADK